MTTIIDVSNACGARAKALVSAGVGTVIRYYSRDTLNPSKQLSLAEAQQLSAAGLRLAIVYEGRFGNKADNFNRACGIADGRYARTYGASTIGQPGGSSVYFGVDFDATPDEIANGLIPYFQGIADAFGHATGEPDYVLGVYGSGAVCQALLSAGLVQRAWLAQSTGWAGYKRFLASNTWSLSQQAATDIAGVSCDPNVQNPDLPIEGFMLGSAQPPTPAPSAGVLYVNARSGLRLRSGPGTDFDIIRLLPFGVLVHPLKTVESWTCVDLQGDGAADGFVSTSFLVESPVGPAPAASLDATKAGDAVHIPELVRQGSSAPGLAAARAMAAASLKGYPKNGCAAHLSALLQQAGIDIPMTWGAGKLAHVIEARGWQRVDVGAQQAGDIGVCLDNTSPPGADHIYLVIKVLALGEMSIADNQNKVDAPHSRFQTGHGKTDTEYFLRAV